MKSSHCVKSVQIQSFFWPVFSRIQTKYGDLFCGSCGSSVIPHEADSLQHKSCWEYRQWLRHSIFSFSLFFFFLLWNLENNLLLLFFSSVLFSDLQSWIKLMKRFCNPSYSLIQCWSMNDWRTKRLDFPLRKKLLLLCNTELRKKRVIEI